MNLHEPLSPFQTEARKASSVIRSGKRVFYQDQSKRNLIQSHLTTENALIPQEIPQHLNNYDELNSRNHPSH